MGKTTSTYSLAITQLVVRDPPIDGVLSTPDDYCIDTIYFFVRKSLSLDQTWYYRSLKYSHEHRHPNGKPGPFDKDEFEQAFGGMVIGKVIS